MSLARRLMNGEIGTPTETVNESLYSADNGASVIAMESAQEMYAISKAFYNYEQADISAIVEGVALEGSQFEAVAEGAINDAFTKIKQFIQKLWAKVKAFFKNVLVFLNAVIMQSKDFVKKYKKQIEDLKDVEVETKIWDYDNDLIDSTDYVDKAMNLCNSYIDSTVETRVTSSASMSMSHGDISDKLPDPVEDAWKVVTDGKCDNSTDGAKYLYNMYRGEKTDSDIKKPEVTLNKSDIIDFVKIIENGKSVSDIKKATSKVDNTFKKAIKAVDECEKYHKDGASKDKETKNTKGETSHTNYARLAKNVSKYLSAYNTAVNQRISIQKNVIKERDNAYKFAISAAIRQGNKKKASGK